MSCDPSHRARVLASIGPARAAAFARATFALTSLLAACCCWRPGGAGASDRVTIRAVGLPLAEVCRRLSSTDGALTVHPDLRGCKVALAVTEADRHQLRQWLARVFGAEWVRHPPGGPPGWDLRRTKDTAAWILRWKGLRERARQRARRVRAARTRVYLDEHIAVARRSPTEAEAPGKAPPPGISSVTLTRFLGTFSDADLDAIAAAVAERSEFHAGGEYQNGHAPIEHAYGGLSAPQRAALDRYLDRLVGEEVRERRTALRIGVHLEDGFVNLEFRLPGRRPLRQRAMAFTVSGEGMERIYHNALMVLLAREPTPGDVLLGARLRVENEKDPVTGEPVLAARPAPAATSDDPRGLLRYPRLSPPRLTYSEVLELVERGGYMVVSDYYSSSVVVRPGKELPAEGTHPLHTVLEGVARPFERVFRVESRTVLSRHCWWPDRDEEEPPYPHPDAWLAAKRRNPRLSVQHLAEIARLTVPQQNCVAAYGAFPHSFAGDIKYLRENRPLAAFLAALPGRLAARIDTPEGLRVRDLPPSARRLLYPAVGMPGGPNPAVERAVLRVVELPTPLRFRTLCLFGEGDLPFWNTSLP